MINFWQQPLSELNPQQWEQLCDGCGRCCVHKLEDEDSGQVHYTNVSCAYLDAEKCACSDYANRLKNVPECASLDVGKIDQFSWLPATCAYRLLAEGQPLPAWHHLLSGSKDSVHSAGISVKNKVISDKYIHPDDMEEYIVKWIT